MVRGAFAAALQMSHLVATLHLFSPKHNSRESVLPGQQETPRTGSVLGITSITWSGCFLCQLECHEEWAQLIMESLYQR